MANDQMTEYQREELRLREKEIELKSETLSLQRKWYRNPTLIGVAIMAYMSAMGVALKEFYSQHTETNKIVMEKSSMALEYMEFASKIIREPDSSEEDEQWARRIFEHFKNVPFRISIDKSSYQKEMKDGPPQQ